jgi:hypothetical protein
MNVPYAPRKYFGFLASVFIVLLVLGISRVDSGEQKPAMVIPETKYDAGTHWEGEIVSHTYTVKNEGTAELRILKVKPG